MGRAWVSGRKTCTLDLKGGVPLSDQIPEGVCVCLHLRVYYTYNKCIGVRTSIMHNKEINVKYKAITSIMV